MKTKLLTCVAAMLLVGSLPMEEPGELADNSLEGSWDNVSFTSDGTNFRKLAGTNWAFHNGTGTVMVDGKLSGRYPYTIDQAYSPPRVTWGQSIHAIYAVEGDTLHICLCTDKRWPSQLRTTGGFWLYRFSRRK